MNEIVVAGVQMDAKIGRVNENLERIVWYVNQAADQGARLVVFPECALSGYVFESLEEGWQAAEPLPGRTSRTVEEVCRRRDVYAVFGMLESSGEDLYNSAVVCGPEGLIGVYRKTHLPFLGIDRFAAPGPGPYQVFQTPFGRIGVLICYDIRFPEPSRCLTLLGADLLLLPTNWPPGADGSPDFTVQARAAENRVYVVAVNRAGVERGVAFIGKSQIVAPGGKRLVVAETTGETMICASLDPTMARQKRVAITPGVFEIDTVGGRRPELYESLDLKWRDTTP